MMDEIVRLQMELEKVKAENERLKNKDFVAEAVKQVEASDSMYRQQCLVIRQKSEAIDSLTLALAEAREALNRIVETEYLPTAVHAADVATHLAREALSNPTSQRASEEMKGLRRIAEVSSIWMKHPDRGTIRLSDEAEAIREALEAYERGKV